MLEAIRHRGPDSSGAHSCSFASVAFARLSILDLQHGDQPFRSEDGRITCFLNGEIYNHRDLREQLRKQGKHFDSGSDAAILPYLYEIYGVHAISMLEGMFIVCIIDESHRRILLARDHIGIKQMYYATGSNVCVFGSELKSLLASGLVEPRLNSDELPALLSLFYTPGNRSLLNNVQSIPAGCMVEFSVDRDPVVTRYASLPTEPRIADNQSATKNVHDALIRSVEKQLEADVPLGLSLSGGIDSSAIAYALAELGHEDVLALTVSYEDTPQEESEAARQVASAFGMKLELLIPPESAIDHDLPFLAWMSDAPIADPALYSQYIVARAARSRVTVLLSGAGGDELFGGYPSYFFSAKQRALHSAPTPLRRLIGALSTDDKRRAIALNDNRTLMHSVLMSSITRNEFNLLRRKIPAASDPRMEIFKSFARHASHDQVNQQMLCDMDTYLPEQLLPMIDRATMATSIEARVPLIDLELIRSASGLGSDVKLGSPPSSKRLLKSVLSQKMPSLVLERRKIGLPSPMERFIRTNWNTLIPQVLLAKDAPLRQWIQPEWIGRLLQDQKTATKRYRILSTLLLFAAWHRWFIELRRTDRPECTTRELFELPAR